MRRWVGRQAGGRAVLFRLVPRDGFTGAQDGKGVFPASAQVADAQIAVNGAMLGVNSGLPVPKVQAGGLRVHEVTCESQVRDT